MKVIYTKLSLSILFLWSVSLCLAQSYSVTHFNEKLAFNASTVYNISQDGEGFIWIGTNSGLIRYDGINFKHFKIEDGLTDLNIFDINIDTSNHVLLHNFSNTLNYYYKGKLYTSQENTKFSNIKFKRIPIAEFYVAGNSFITTDYGENYFLYQTLENGQIVERRKIWLKTGKTIVAIFSLDKFYYIFYGQKEDNNTNYNVYYKTQLVHQGQIEGFASLLAFNTIKDQFIVSTSLPPTSIIFYKSSPDNPNLEYSYQRYIEGYTIKNVIPCENHLFITVKEGGLLKIDSNGAVEHLLKGKTVNNLLVDNQSNLWVGTDGDGLYCLQKHGMTNLGINQLKISNCVTSLYHAKNGKMYAGFNKLSVVEIDPTSNQITQVYHLSNKKKPVHRRVRKIIQDDQNHILCATDDGLMKIQLTPHLSTKSIFKIVDPGGAIKDITSLQKNEIWIGASGGLRLNKKSGIYPSDFTRRVLSLKFDLDSTLWIGTLHGLFYKKKSQSSIRKSSFSFLESKKINDIYILHDIIYLATDSGICLLDKQNFSLLQFITVQHGLSSNQCKKLTIHNNTIWISTSAGISKVELINNGRAYNKIEVFNTKNGLLSNYVNDIEVYNDTIWAATNDGISIFPSKYSPKLNSPTINIIGAKTNLTEHNTYHHIAIPPDKNNISISFSDMSFRDGNIGRYKYRLKPLTEKWDTTTENVITYSELSPDDYVFEVKSINQNDHSSTKTGQLKFVVQPKYYQTLFFKLCILIIVLAAISFILYWKGRMSKRKSYFEKTIAQLELEAIKAQINPHFIYNCLGSIKATIIKKENSKAEEQLSIFAKLVRKTLTLSQYNYIPIEDEISYLTNYLEMEKVRFKEQLQYSITTHNLDNLDELLIPSMLIQPFVENSVKHGIPENQEINSIIDLDFTLQGTIILCTIADNGPGIEKTLANKNTSRTSHGMRITSERAQKYNKLFNTTITITASEKQTGGTLITIKMPFK